ncbi:hypothetical protein [Streptomyces sp. NPDC001222]|uniref:hypothetical protein n=1 Tax=Streptomyces sp. NPDC001222 TaxID=3364548 RepID=UPI0036AAF93A
MIPSGSRDWYALVLDSSAIQTDPRFDGERMLLGRSREHMAELAEQYKRSAVRSR